ncbi:MAG: HEPN domain-containing protein, partial [Thermomicrobiales bacterium]
ELKRHWMQYLVVRISGFLETSISYIYNEYASDKANARILSFLTARLENPGNLRTDRLYRLIKEFGQDWHDEVIGRPDAEQIAAAVNSIVVNRNHVAHGENISVGINQAREYFMKIMVLLDFLVEQCERESHTGRLSQRRVARH